MKERMLRVRVISADGGRMRINLPFSVAGVCVRMGLDVTGNVAEHSPLKDIDLKRILADAEGGASGKLAEVKTGNGDVVEIFAE